MTGFLVSFLLGAVSSILLIWAVAEVWWRFTPHSIL